MAPMPKLQGYEEGIPLNQQCRVQTGFAMTTSSIVWVATKRSRCWSGLPNIWLMKIGSGLAREEVLVLEDVES